ncbi:iron-containing alcohol dehydrogenase [Treponema sp. HNW]|uniref:iron-containing alcohol dehydrogenase n=1 Tax=Treponema sp. HNW TaxID=3116654 RepID=UPI003D1184E7
MFFPKAVYCRLFQAAFRLTQPLLPYREPQVIFSCVKLDKVLQKEALKSVLIVTDRGIVENGLTEPLIRVLQENGIRFCVYDKTEANPTVSNVEEAFTLYKDSGAEGIIAIGGGSPMDCAKAVGARIAYPEKPVEKMKGTCRVRRPLVPLIAVPTTAGTGSEVTLAAIITDGKKHEKYALMSFPLIPRYAVLDASLTYSLPPHITASTGIDALTHAVEAYIGRSTTRETRALALEAAKLVFENIEAAYKDGSNHRARENMLHAAHKAGLAFSKSYVGYIHAVAHSLGGFYGTPHGLANAVIMPYVLEAYGKSVHKKLYQMALATGICSKNDDCKKGAELFIQAVKDLNARINIPDKIAGIKKADIPFLAALAEKEANPLYPVPKLMTRTELAAFYYQIADWNSGREK